MKNLLNLIDIEVNSNIANDFKKCGIFNNIHSFVDLYSGSPKNSDSLHYYNIYDEWNSIVIKCDYSAYDLITHAEEFKDTFLKILDRWTYPRSNKTNYLYINDLFSKYLNFAYNFLEDNKITDLFIGIPHIPISYAFYVVAKIKDIRILFKHHIPMNTSSPYQLYLFTKDIDGKIDFDLNKLELNNLHFIQDYKDTLNSDVVILKRSEIFGDIFYRLKKIFIQFPTRYIQFFHSIIMMFKIDFKIKRFYVKNSLDYESFEEEKFLYFPFHLQPEATSNPMASRFINQFELAFNIAKLIPDDYFLVIKEHPAYWKNLPLGKRIIDSRSLYDYKLLASQKKIIIANYNIDSQSLIKASKGIISLTGSVIFESFLLRKKALVLGHSIYTNLPNTCEKILNEQLSQTIDNFMVFTPKDYSIEDEYNYLSNGFVYQGRSDKEKSNYAQNVLKVYLNVWS